MAIVQRTDLNLNNQKRFAEGAVATFPAKLSEGNNRLGTGPVYVDPADEYQAYCLPKMSVVKDIFIYVREAFVAGTTATITTIVNGVAVETALDVATADTFVLATVSDVGGALENGALYDTVDGFSVSFNQTSTEGVLQIIAGYVSIDEKSGKYVATV